MKTFRCRVCDNQLYFENSLCVSCGTALGYSRAERAIVPVDADGKYVDAGGWVWWVCRNLNLSGCTWLSKLEGGQCFSCDLTRTRPRDEDLQGLANFQPAEQAKRHLIIELDALGLPVVSKFGEDGDPVNGLAFDLLSATDQQVTIGHADGVVTIDLSESDSSHRERIRAQLDEPYRTMLGHFRHEIGHYYESQLVRGDDLEKRSHELFGDPGEDYQAALDRHYVSGPPPGWEDSFISSYATMHPFEDFAESWAHFLHISDTIDTARSTGLITIGPVTGFSNFRDVVAQVWIPLSGALNQINRSMGQGDLYPFVIPAPVLDKLDFVAALATGRATPTPP